ncbi:MAG TPA: hypothetical protein DCQ26_04790 [Marinilabiliales bacterium]|jgi:Fe-S-cluster containining protein|nr:MAG: hypothetical protein A2W95_00500 [Bacteroidetes bacterium GWA2_40_14]OFX60400.1 MAG: hypothetical protein A2W84_04740 [Bacteroidetes bacterium GWC2_40_13]OFX91862.1 MAG: hypothetical protein A2W97_11845 [Bacteroidetes bacterium GWE2_40_63]OFZ28249.1 MAG: hypothetical protein A2437_05095 [Bacteroidetes bacterium RIFOXYC2_FULL_40_12]HAM97907.1 hypothetical protein [Marinilabiliales bacterium]
MDKAIYFEKYRALRNEIDDTCDRLSKMHVGKMQCRQGCDSCCEKFSVFPLEFEAIKEVIQSDGTFQVPQQRNFEKFRKSCLFLKDGSCSMYEHRPIICRTQGFPLLYQSGDGTAYELSVCRLNFKEINVDTFHDGNALFMPPFNSRLYLLNQEFVKKFYPKQFKPNTRIGLSELI